jgi:2-polyprenyl-6-hydroxyphenyl methylase/3-demethylubiquinone-9 3-methyltransferase
MIQKSSLNAQEIENFSKDSSQWWDPTGPFAPLHRLNPTRMKYIRDQILAHYADGVKSTKNDNVNQTPLKGFNILDIGCGGGLVCESLNRMGAKTTGLDADSNAIAVAQDHAAQSGLNINYQAMTSEVYLDNNKKTFDVVCALEIIEHVDHPDFFIETALKLLKPGGLLILSTLNRTAKSALLGIFVAEYVLNWVPKGTHTHNKFVKPSELATMLRLYGAETIDVTGLKLDPMADEFVLSKSDLAVNYFLCAKKPS